jgi:predicted adenine nucleotide alpha hydrolase (AANH) superfamily ATPase
MSLKKINMDESLIEIFGKIVRTSRDTGLDIVSNYKNQIEIPKNPDEEQRAFIELVKSLDDIQFQRLQKGIKYCIELSLFKLISTIENGVDNYSFTLSIENNKDKVQLVGKDIDNEINLKYWNWIY